MNFDEFPGNRMLTIYAIYYYELIASMRPSDECSETWKCVEIKRFGILRTLYLFILINLKQEKKNHVAVKLKWVTINSKMKKNEYEIRNHQQEHWCILLCLVWIMTEKSSLMNGLNHDWLIESQMPEKLKQHSQQKNLLFSSLKNRMLAWTQLCGRFLNYYYSCKKMKFMHSWRMLAISFKKNQREKFS